MLVASKFFNYPRCQLCSIAIGKLSLIVFMGKVANKGNHGQNDQNFHCGQEKWSDVHRKILLGIGL